MIYGWNGAISNDQTLTGILTHFKVIIYNVRLTGICIWAVATFNDRITANIELERMPLFDVEHLGNDIR